MLYKKAKTAALVLVGLFAMISSSQSPGQTPVKSPLSKWRSRDYPGIGFAGSSKCAECHGDLAAAQRATPMASALEVPGSSQILGSRLPLTFRNGPYSYKIAREGNRILYTVSDGTSAISEPIMFCFGRGVAGQTYVFQHGGGYYESRVSYYQELQNLDITILHPRGVPGSLEEALGRPMSGEAVRGCFDCHSTAAQAGLDLNPGKVVPGVTCERCHGPGEKHIAAVKAGNLKDLSIFNPGTLDAFDQMQEFCGACHQGFETVMLMPDQGGINNIRFQPYRMFKSQAHFINDSRISCVACHDPHGKLERDPAFYDSKCLACHLSSREEAKTSTRNASACPVSKQQCVTCHMPKVDLPEMHFKFTDHWIRIAKPGTQVPR